MAIEVSMIAYANPWNSGKPVDKGTVFLGGLQALSTSMLDRMGGLGKETLCASNWGFKPLDKSFDKKFAKGNGSLKDGLVSFSANWLKGCMMNCRRLDMTDTQMVFLERPKVNELVLAFRGTCEVNDIVSDIQARKRNYRVCSRVQGSRGNVHRGIYKAWSRVQDTVLDVVKKRVAQGINKILVTGHSLGGALATFCSLAIKEQVQGNYQLKCYTFGSAVTGDKKFREYYKCMVPDNFGIVYDKDIVPLLGSSNPDLGYRHPGIYVHVNDNGLWINPAKGDVVEDGTVTLLHDKVNDHFAVEYLLAMHFHQASTATASVKDKLKEAWKKYLRQDETFDQHCVVASLEGEKVMLHRMAKPNTAAMQEVFRGTFDDEAVALIEPEMFRLMCQFSAKQADWKHFVIAIGNLNYSSCAHKMRCRCIAQLHAEFVNFDMDEDDFLTQKEFEALCTQTAAPFSKKLKVAFATEENVNSMKQTFKDIDANRDGVLSFDEYVIWRCMGEVAHTLTGPWFDDNPFRFDVADVTATAGLDAAISDCWTPPPPPTILAGSS